MMLQKIKKLGFILSVLCLLNSCGDEPKEDMVNSVSKNASIETEVSVQHADSIDILITKHKVWVKNNLVKELIQKDTIPALGDTLITVENNGTEIQKPTKKDYEFYITVQ